MQYKVPQLKAWMRRKRIAIEHAKKPGLVDAIAQWFDAQ
jgi:hypothetical protein